MIELYYCSDQGLIAEKRRTFLVQNPDALIVNCKSYERMFAELSQTSLFNEVSAYILVNPLMLSPEWKQMAINNENLSLNNKYLEKLYPFLVSCQNDQIPVLIEVYVDALLTNKHIKAIEQLLSNPQPKIALLNNRTKIKILNQLLDENQILMDNETKTYFYELLPKNMHQINEVFLKIQLYGKQELKLHEVQQLAGNHKEADFFKLVDNFFLNNHYEWIEIFHEKCVTTEDANQLLNICVFKVNELWQCFNLFLEKHDWKMIAKIMQKSEFMLFGYQNIVRNNPNLKKNLLGFILKLHQYCVDVRTQYSITPHNLKQLFLSYHVQTNLNWKDPKC